MRHLDENPNCARTYATFRLAGDELIPADVSAALGVEPTYAHTMGDEMRKGHRGAVISHQRTGIWLLESRPIVDSTSLERHLVYLLEIVEPAAEALREIGAQQGIRADFFCFWESASGHGGPEFSAKSLKRIADLDATLGLDLYGPRSEAGGGSD